MRLFMVGFLPLGVACFGEMLSRIAGLYVERKNRVARQKFLQRSITLCDLDSMDEDNNGDVDREEFISFMLVALQKVTKEDIDELRQVFRRLDVDNSNSINKFDLQVIAKRRKMQNPLIRDMLSNVGEEDDDNNEDTNERSYQSIGRDATATNEPSADDDDNDRSHIFDTSGNSSDEESPTSGRLESEVGRDENGPGPTEST